jgi:hypothetical protein
MRNSTPTSIYLNPAAREALGWLRSQPGGFNLAGHVNDQIIQLATERGWRREAEMERREYRLTVAAQVDAAGEVEPATAFVVDIRPDLPGDRGKLWALHLQDEHWTSEDKEALTRIAARHNLPWERGARRYYVDRARLAALVQSLNEEGFTPALSLDAAQAI